MHDWEDQERVKVAACLNCQCTDIADVADADLLGNWGQKDVFMHVVPLLLIIRPHLLIYKAANGLMQLLSQMISIHIQMCPPPISMPTLEYSV